MNSKWAEEYMGHFTNVYADRFAREYMLIVPEWAKAKIQSLYTSDTPASRKESF